MEKKFQDFCQMTRKLHNLFYDWPLRIKTAEDMLPYMFAAHKYNYDRYGLFYVRSMTWLPMDN